MGLSEDGAAKARTCVAVLLCFLLVFVTPLLVGMSFSRVDYYQVGFRKSRTSGKLDRSEVYESGRHMLGPDYFIMAYPATIQDIVLDGLSAWSRADDDDAGTILSMDVTIQYRIVEERLQALNLKVGFDVDQFVRNVCINVVKNVAVNFSADQFLEERRAIEGNISAVLDIEMLAVADVELRNFALRHVGFPSNFYARKLAASVQVQNNDAEEFGRLAAITRGNSSVQVKAIENEANELVEAANADASLVVKLATNNATAIRGQAASAGLVALAQRLGVSDQADVLSLDYMYRLLTNAAGSTKRYVNFPQLPSAVGLTGV